MSVNTKQGLFVSVIAIAVLLCCAFGISIHSARVLHEVMVSSAQAGLESVFDQCVAAAAGSTQRDPAQVQPADIRKVLLKADGSLSDRLPSFLSVSDVFLPRETISIPTNQLFCVVRMPGARLFGITGRRTWRPVGERALKQWPHQRLDQPQ
jgi:hypothetical protein